MAEIKITTRILLEKDIEDSTLQQINVLLMVVSPKSTPIESNFHLKEVVNENHLFVACDSGANDLIIGMATLVDENILSRRCGVVHDVVVLPSYLKMGVGRTLMNALIDYAKYMGLESLELTSHESRDVANLLYQKLGFVKRETSVYRLNLTDFVE